MKNGKLNHKDIILYSKANENAWTSIEQSTAFTIYKDIDFYEFCEKTTLATIKIDLPLLIEKLGLNAKAFADELFKYGYDIFIAELGKAEQYFLTKLAFTKTAKKPNV